MKIFGEYPAVLFRLKKELYGVAAPLVQHIGAIPKVVVVPKVSVWTRGVINFRDTVIPLIDLRVRLGMGSFLEEIKDLTKMMKQREEDHKNWLNELENSIREAREFKLCLDPHGCKFGKWYDSYKPKSYSEAQFLKKFDEPHKHIHQIAVHVEDLLHQNQQEQAFHLIEETRQGALSELIELFRHFSTITGDLVHREIILVINCEDGHARKAIAVDTIETVERLEENSIEEMPAQFGHTGNSLVQHIAKRKKTGDMVYLLQSEKLFTQQQ